MPIKIGSLKLYKTPELAILFGVSRWMICSYFRTKKLNGKKLGRRWFITQQDLHNYFINKQS